MQCKSTSWHWELTLTNGRMSNAVVTNCNNWLWLFVIICTLLPQNNDFWFQQRAGLLPGQDCHTQSGSTMRAPQQIPPSVITTLLPNNGNRIRSLRTGQDLVVQLSPAFQVLPVNRICKKIFPFQMRCRKAGPRPSSPHAASTVRRYTIRRPPHIPSVNTHPNPPLIIVTNVLLFSSIAYPLRLSALPPFVPVHFRYKSLPTFRYSRLICVSVWWACQPCYSHA